MKLADSLLLEFDQEAQTTKRVLERIPDEKLTWKPHPTSFSLGQLAMHIASGPGQIAAAVVPYFFLALDTRKYLLTALVFFTAFFSTSTSCYASCHATY